MNRSNIKLEDDHGFTLIELLVVILIIGILAAIAVPAFLGQRVKAQDSRAKSDVRNMLSEIEACWRSTDGFAPCQTELNGGGTSLPVGTGPGQVWVVAANSDSFVLTATSEAQTGGANHTFTIEHTVGGDVVRSCLPVGEGGCRDDGSW